MSKHPLSLGRRQFTLGLGAAGLATGAGFATMLRGRPAAAAAAKSAYPGINIGYAAITWGDANARQAMMDIAELGYPGVQLRATIARDWKHPTDLQTDLDHFKLTFACVSGGSPSADPAKREEEVEKFAKLATFAKAAGALHIQATAPPRGATVEKAQLESFAETLNAIGKRTAALGLPLAFHPHMDQLVQTAEEVDVVMKKTDPKVVKLLLDTGHWTAAGDDPAKGIKKYAKRLAMLHIKDVTVDEAAAAAPVAADGKKKKAYKFVELGQGKVDLKAVFVALKAARWKGWAVAEIDSAPKDRTAKEAAAANKAFLEGLGLVIARPAKASKAAKPA